MLIRGTTIITISTLLDLRNKWKRVSSYASGARTVPVPLHSPGRPGEEKEDEGRDRTGAPDARYRSQVHASGQLRSLLRWMLDAINSADINRDRDHGAGETERERGERCEMIRDC